MMRNERGFAIPMVVLLTAVITVILSSGFARVRADRQVAEAQEVSGEALAIARGGLHLFLESRSTRPPDNTTDTMYVTGGYAIINANVVQNPADTMASQTWVVRSTGYVIDAATGPTPRAQRTVAQFVEWQTGAINVRAALTAPNGIQQRRYGKVDIDGDNYCGSAVNKPGLRTTAITGPSNSGIKFDGAPPLIEEGASAGGTVADETNIDWLDILAGGIIPDRTTFQTGFNNEIILVTGDLTLSSGFEYGSGLLIVTGDLNVSSWFYWQGIILTGGGAQFNGSSTYVYGALVTGLNEQLSSGNPSPTQLGMASSSQNSYRAYIRYYGCYVDNALSALTGFAPIENGWVDNWSTY